jgi:ribosomal protein L37E
MAESPVVTIDPLRAADLIAGEFYDTWICEECLSVIALAPRAPGADSFDLPDGLIRIKCSHCGLPGEYTMHARRVRKYPWSAAATPPTADALP